MGKLKEKMPKVDAKSVTKGAKGFFTEFKEFAMKGSVVDLAVGMIIGAAFTSIVNSFVNDIVTPFISLFTKGLDFSQLYIPLYRIFDKGTTYESLAAAQEAGAAVITIGNFITAILNFLIVALVIFIVFPAILISVSQSISFIIIYAVYTSSESLTVFSAFASLVDVKDNFSTSPLFRLLNRTNRINADVKTPIAKNILFFSISLIILFILLIALEIISYLPKLC